MTNPQETLAEKIARLEREHAQPAAGGLDAKIAALEAEAPQRRAGDKPRGFRTPAQIARENAADVGQATDVAEQDTYGQRLGSMAERAASVLPGGAAALTGTRNLTKRIIGEPETWEESARANAAGAEEGAANAPGVTIPKAVPLFGGSRLTLADLPAGAAGFRALTRFAPGLSAAKAGAAYAGATRVTNPLPESVLSRAGGTALASVTGAALPVVAEGLGTFGGRVKARVGASRAPEYAANVNARTAARGATADAEYGAFRSGNPLPMTPDLTKLMGGENASGLPIVQHAIKAARAVNPDLMDLPDTHPAVLVEAHKIIGNKAWRKDNGFAEGRAADVFLNAIEDAAQSSDTPGLRDAIGHYATSSREIGALQSGRKALKQNASSSGVPDKDVGVTSLDALRRTSDARTPAAQQALKEGVLGELNTRPIFSLASIPGLRWFPTGFSAFTKTAPDVLRASEGKGPSAAFAGLMEKLRAPEPALPAWLRRRGAEPLADIQGALREGSYAMGEPITPAPIQGRLRSGQHRLLSPSPEEQLGAELSKARVEGRQRVEGEAPSALSRLLRSFSDDLTEGKRRSEMTPTQRRAFDRLLARSARP